MSKNGLKKSLGFLSLVAFGVGDILGAGVYALIGKTAGLVGNACWLSFLASLVVAALTGFSYAELASRFPRSAGESFYCFKAFGNFLFSYLVGFLVLMSGVVSMAVVSHGFAGYVQAVRPGIPQGVILVIFFLVLAAINFWGMKESSLTNIVCTAVEISGLLIVIAAGAAYFGKIDYLAITPAAGKDVSTAFLQASVLAFYAFIGFEDMVKAAEESHEPARIIPRAIVTSLIVVAFLYVLTALAAVSVVPVPELAESRAPLMLVVQRGFPGLPRGLFTFIALFAVTNTALVNFVMSSRLIYGMAEEGLAPSFLNRLHPSRSTPHVAIGVVFLMALTLALTGTLFLLAQSTALILLLVFFIINVSLVRLKAHSDESSPARFSVPFFIPILGALSALLLIFYVDRRAYITVSILALVGFFLYIGWARMRNRP